MSSDRNTKWHFVLKNHSPEDVKTILSFKGATYILISEFRTLESHFLNGMIWFKSKKRKSFINTLLNNTEVARNTPVEKKQLLETISHIKKTGYFTEKGKTPFELKKPTHKNQKTMTSRTRSPQSKRWHFVLKNYTPEDVTRLSTPANEIDYVLMTEMKTPESKELHGLVCFKSRKRQSFTITFLSLPHPSYRIEVTRCLLIQDISLSIDLLKKDGNFIETGHPPTLRKKTPKEKLNTRKEELLKRGLISQEEQEGTLK